MQVDPNYRLSASLSAAQWNVIFLSLKDRPWSEVNELIASVQAQHLAALTSPPTPPSAYSPASPDQIREWLTESERNRRGSERTFDTTPTPGGSPDNDYGFLTASMSAALMQMDEGLPNGQLPRVAPAFRALRAATEHLEMWLRARGVL